MEQDAKDLHPTIDQMSSYHNYSSKTGNDLDTPGHIAGPYLGSECDSFLCA